MMRFLKSWIIKLVGRTELFMLYALRYHSFLAEVGWFTSWRTRSSVDRNGDPLPWFTYPAISFLERRAKPEMKVFEYGCGNSTLWWAARVASVRSCEHDEHWHDSILAKLPANVMLHLRRLGDTYASCVLEDRTTFDIIVVDGRERVKCITTCLAALADGGVVILDNAERSEYQDGIRFLVQQGFRELAFDGPSPIVMQPSRTSIFYRPATNAFGI
jgi:precorrin-6B methylase 2